MNETFDKENRWLWGGAIVESVKLRSKCNQLPSSMNDELSHMVEVYKNILQKKYYDIILPVYSSRTILGEVAPRVKLGFGEKQESQKS